MKLSYKVTLKQCKVWDEEQNISTIHGLFSHNSISLSFLFLLYLSSLEQTNNRTNTKQLFQRYGRVGKGSAPFTHPILSHLLFLSRIPFRSSQQIWRLCPHSPSPDFSLSSPVPLTCVFDFPLFYAPLFQYLFIRYTLSFLRFVTLLSLCISAVVSCFDC